MQTNAEFLIKWKRVEIFPTKMPPLLSFGIVEYLKIHVVLLFPRPLDKLINKIYMQTNKTWQDCL